MVFLGQRDAIEKCWRVWERRLDMLCTTGPIFQALLLFDMLYEGSRFKANGMLVMRE